MSQRAGDPVAATWPEAILFDLDGTLIDSGPDIAAAVNELLATEGMPPLAVPAVEAMIGNGVVKLVERAYAASGRPLDGAALEEAVERMMPIYGRHITNLTTALPGAVELLAACAGLGVKLAIVSNKPMPFMAAIVAHYGFAPYLSVVQGQEKGLAAKPAPDMLLSALDRLGVAAGRAIMVGDSVSDVRAASAAGMSSVLLRGGYTTVSAEELAADIVVDALLDIPQALERLRPSV